MNAWWNALDFPLQLFYAVGALSGFVLVLLALLTFLGVDHHDFSGADHGDGVGILSQRTVTGFFFGFGWSGAIALRRGVGLPVAILAACAVGAAFLFGIWFLMRVLYGMRSSGTLDYRNAIGQTGTVYVTIPPAMAAGGQIEVMVQGRLQTVHCLTRAAAPISPGTKIKVTGLVDETTLEVAPL